MSTAYTIGAIRSYEEALESGDVQKLGRSSEYEGGWAWSTLEAARGMASRTDLGFVAGVYELSLPDEWSRCTFMGGDGVHHLTLDSKIVRRVWPTPDTLSEFAEVWIPVRDVLGCKPDLNESEMRRVAAIDYVLDLLSPPSEPLSEEVKEILHTLG